jgi:hypothetical protein
MLFGCSWMLLDAFWMLFGCSWMLLGCFLDAFWMLKFSQNIFEVMKLGKTKEKLRNNSILLVSFFFLRK